MKKRDIITLVVSVVILLIAGALIYRYFVPPSQNNGVQVVVPRPVQTTFDQQQLDTLKNDVTDFTPDITPTDSAAKPIIQ
jgi:flagellar basal body-associated protein FliL